ncbi:MAG: exodeoxyribonuclease VII small subunit [Tannerella sp.]|jgi:exodeoxyribonuclease VII small subunit|nr:exodeoxyribonuclease VII small subunit [Tannerella sp.]
MEMTYTEAVQRLRAIVAEMEQDTPDVDLLLERVKEAGQLITSCREKLFRADGEIKKTLEDLP